MKKYGFFGGSFNPVTKAHIELALEIIGKYKLDKVIFVPMGNKYNKKGLEKEEHRYNMLQIVTKKYEKLEVSSIELGQAKNISTLEAFKMIDEQYNNIKKYYIIGVDNLHKIILSKDCNELVKNYKHIVIQRNEIDIEELINTNTICKKNRRNFSIMENLKHMCTSSSIVREKLIDNNKDCKTLLYEEILDYIIKNKLYLI